MNIIYNKAIHKEALALKIKGKTYREIGEKLGVPFTTVYYWLKESKDARVHDIVRRKPRK